MRNFLISVLEPLARRVNHPPAAPGRVLVIRVDRLGDLIHTTPLIRALALDGWSVDVACRAVWREILLHNPRIAHSFTLEDICPRWPEGWMKLARWLRLKQYDAILIPHASPPPLLWASLLSGCPYRLVPDGGKWARLTLHAFAPAPPPESDRPYAQDMLNLARPLGSSQTDLRPELFLTPDETAAAKNTVNERWPASAHPLVTIHAGGGHLRPGQPSSACNLPIPEYARLAALLLEHTAVNIIITGGHGSEATAIAPAFHQLRNHPRCWYAVGELGLRPLAALLKESDLTIVGSTGPLHLASAVGATTLSPFCPVHGDNAIVWGNRGGSGHVIARSPATCPRCSAHPRVCGDFGGEINADTLFARALSILQLSDSSV